MTAVPTYPLDTSRLERTLTRLETIVEDCQPVAALTDKATLQLIRRLIEDRPSLAGLRWVDTEAGPDPMGINWRPPPDNPLSPAVIQYTSGSTRMPRGVMLGHRNILENQEVLRSTFGYTEKNTFVGWVPLAHDLGLFSHVVQPLYVAALSVLMTPEAFIQSPSRWMKAVARYPNVATHAPNFAWELCARRITADELDDLDLSGLHTADLGGEPIRLNTRPISRRSVRVGRSFSQCGTV